MQTYLLEGISVFLTYAISIFFLIFTSIYISQAIYGNRQSRNIFSLYFDMGGGLVYLCLFAYILILASKVWSPFLRIGSFVGMGIALFTAIKGLMVNRTKITFDIYNFIILFVVLFIILFRLSFLNHIVLPPYSDSPIHYLAVQNFLNSAEPSYSNLSIDTLFSTYYHFGFHSLTTWMVTISGIDSIKIMPLVGQLSVALAPIYIAVLIYAITKNNESAVFSTLVAAFGWSMPAFAANWGKYPALLSISLFPIVLTFPLVFPLKGQKARIRLAFIFLIVGIVIIHTRMIICLALVYFSYFLVRNLNVEKRNTPGGSILISILFIISVIPLLQITKDFYQTKVTWGLLLLTPFSFYKYPKETATVFMSATGLWFVNIIPETLGISRELLDRQFLEILSFIPLSIIGGMGFSSLVETDKVPVLLRKTTVIIALVVTFLYLVQDERPLPDPCCNYFTKNDEAAFEWIKNNADSHSLFIISAFKNEGVSYPTDAGMWIYPLLRIPTNKELFVVKWDKEQVFQEYCSSPGNNTYVYLGGKEYSFNKPLINQLNWYTLVFQKGTTYIYKIESCSN